jgi:two-component system response regulator NreC
MGTIRVFLVDDHTILRQGLRAMLEGREDMELVGEAADGRTAVREVLRTQPDVVVMDVAMPHLNGIEATRQIRRDCPATQVLILSMHTDEEYVIEALRAGAAGYLVKDSAASELVVALHAVRREQPYFSAAVASILVDDSGKNGPGETAPPEAPRLTPREREVIQLIAEGYTNLQIAQALHISVKTVETHRQHIMDKLNIHDIAGLVKYAIRHGLTSLQ